MLQAIKDASNVPNHISFLKKIIISLNILADTDIYYWMIWQVKFCFFTTPKSLPVLHVLLNWATEIRNQKQQCPPNPASDYIPHKYTAAPISIHFVKILKSTIRGTSCTQPLYWTVLISNHSSRGFQTKKWTVNRTAIFFFLIHTLTLFFQKYLQRKQSAIIKYNHLINTTTT